MHSQGRHRAIGEIALRCKSETCSLTRTGIELPAHKREFAHTSRQLTASKGMAMTRASTDPGGLRRCDRPVGANLRTSQRRSRPASHRLLYPVATSGIPKRVPLSRRHFPSPHVLCCRGTGPFMARTMSGCRRKPGCARFRPRHSCKAATSGAMDYMSGCLPIIGHEDSLLDIRKVSTQPNPKNCYCESLAIERRSGCHDGGAGWRDIVRLGSRRSRP